MNKIEPIISRDCGLGGLAGELLIGAISNICGLEPRTDIPGTIRNLFDEVVCIDDYSFEKGLTGIGWVLEFLCQKNLIDEDSDTLLYDFDDNIYKWAITQTARTAIDLPMVMGMVDYFYLRGTSKNIGHDFLREFTHYECMKMLLSRLNDETIDLLRLYRSKSPDTLQIRQLCLISLKLTGLSVRGIDEKIYEQALYSGMEFLVEYFRNKANHLINQQDGICNLMLCKLAAQQYNNTYWIEQLQKILKIVHPLFLGRNHQARNCDLYHLLGLLLKKSVIDKNDFEVFFTNTGNAQMLVLILTSYVPIEIQAIHNLATSTNN